VLHRLESISSLKVRLTEPVVVATSVAPLAGVDELTVGLVVSAVDPVVKERVLFVSEFPALSLWLEKVKVWRVFLAREPLKVQVQLRESAE